MRYMGITVRFSDGSEATFGESARIGRTREDVADMIDQNGSEATLQAEAPLWVRRGAVIVRLVEYAPVVDDQDYARLTI